MSPAESNGTSFSGYYFLPIQSSTGSIEQVSSVKLLGFHLDAKDAKSWRVFARLTRECRNISNLHVIQHTRNVATAQNYNSRKFGLKNVTGGTECNFFGESCFGESGRHPLNSKIADGYRK